MVFSLAAGPSRHLFAHTVAQTQSQRQPTRAALFTPHSAAEHQKLIVGRRRGGLDIDPLAPFVELHLAVDQREQCPVAAGADVLAGDEFGAALADQDAARGDKFAAEPFYPESFADAVAPVVDAAAAFFVCHKFKL